MLTISLHLFGQTTIEFSLNDIKSRNINGKTITTDILLNPRGLQFHDSLILIHNTQTQFHFDLLNL